VLIEETEHAIRAVAKHVSVLAALDEFVGAPEVSTNIATTSNGVKRFRIAIAEHGLGLQLDPVAITKPILIVDWEIAIDTTTNLVALGPDLDRFGNFDHAVCEDANVAVKTENAFVGERSERQTKQE
jgi:hypothetical protein